MGYRIDIDHKNCINCGICMDVCPVEALDMSRPQSPGVEAGPGQGPIPWLMERPIQVGECVGCSICIRECPVSVMTLATVAGPTALAPRQGPIHRPVESAPANAWIPLSSVTREALKRTKVSPFDDVLSWRTGAHGTGPRGGTAVERDSGKAPCQVACPARTDAGRYVGLVAAGRYDDAYAVAAEVNPFPSVCGWICTAPCESACRRGTLDEPISIRTIKRFAVEHGKLPAVARPAKKRAERVAIVGGGPAGMSAAYYLARLGYSVSVMEAMPVPGGMMAIGIPEYRLPRSVLREEIERIVGARRRAPPRHRDGPRLHARRPGARGLQGRLPCDRRLQEPAARRPGRRRAWGDPGDALPQGGQPRRESAPVRPGHRGRRRQHGHGRRSFRVALRRRLREHRLPSRPR